MWSGEGEPRSVFFSNALDVSAFLFLAALAITLTFVPLRASHDEFWHLKTGKWIAEHGLPEKEIFTYTAVDFPWHNHEWLSQLLFWKVYEFGEVNRPGGIRALIIFKSAFIALTFLGLGLFSAKRTGAPVLAAFAAGMCCGLARRTFYPRPPFITYGLMALVLGVMLSWRDRKVAGKWLFALVPLFAFWANLHGGFMAGLVILGAFWIEATADWALAIWRMEETRNEEAYEPASAKSRCLILTLVLVLCFAATFSTPYGYHLYELAGRVMADRRLDGIIAELMPPDWRFVWILDGCWTVLLFSVFRPRTFRATILPAFLCTLTLFFLRGVPSLLNLTPGANHWIEVYVREAVLLVALLAAGMRSKEKIGLAHTLILLFFAHQAVEHVRHLPLLAVVLAPATAQSLADWFHPNRALDFCYLLSDKLKDRGRSLGFLGDISTWVLLGGLAAFYAFWPGEAYVFASSRGLQGERTEALKTPNFFDRNLRLLRGVELEPGEYPEKAVDFLIEHNLPGRLWNGGNYAGYLIWRLSPEKYQVFTDNRYDIWGGEFIQDEHIVLDGFQGDPDRGIPSWNEVLDKWKANTLLIPIEAPLERTLENEEKGGQSEWIEKYNDRAFAIWTRRKFGW